MEIIAHLTKNDLDAVLLACTDLQLLAPKHDLVMIIDTMKILVNSTVKMALDSDSI